MQIGMSFHDLYTNWNLPPTLIRFKITDMHILCLMKVPNVIMFLVNTIIHPIP